MLTEQQAQRIALDLLIDLEGGFQNDPRDAGNYRPDGTLVGTKYGISARAYPAVDIPNLTRAQAEAIYLRDYWAAIPPELPAGLRIAAFDMAVHSGVQAALTTLARAGTAAVYCADRLDFLASLGDKWTTYGRGWTRRVARVLREAGALDDTAGALRVNQDRRAETLVLHDLTPTDRLRLALSRRPTFDGALVLRWRPPKIDVRREP